MVKQTQTQYSSKEITARNFWVLNLRALTPQNCQTHSGYIWVTLGLKTLGLHSLSVFDNFVGLALEGLTPRSFLQLFLLIYEFPILISLESLELKWHLSVFPFIWLSQNHLKGFSNDFCKYAMTSSTLLHPSS